LEKRLTSPLRRGTRRRDSRRKKKLEGEGLRSGNAEEKKDIIERKKG